MRTYIAEKPDMGRQIAKAIGGSQKANKGYIELANGDVVTWCIGHLLEFKMPEAIRPELKRWMLDSLPLNIMNELELVPNPKTRTQLQCVLRLIKKSNEIIHLGDWDQAGQKIVDAVLEHAGYKKKVWRGKIIDMNANAIRTALKPENLLNNKDFTNWSDAEHCRSLFDYYYGMNMSRTCSLLYQQTNKDFKGVLSVGRVQTIIMAMVIGRQLANKNHVPKDFYPVNATIETDDGESIQCKVSFNEDFISQNIHYFDESNRIKSKEFAEFVTKELVGSSMSISSVVTMDKYEHPPLPFSLLTLQKMASQLFNYDPELTLKITQDLREKKHLISYNRTDCSYLFESTHAEAEEIMQTVSSVLPTMQAISSYADFNIKSRAFNDKNVSAHHGIIPVINDDAQSRVIELNEMEQNLYLMICRNFVAQFFPKKHKQHTKVQIVTDSLTLTANQTFVKAQGWNVLFNGEDTVEDEEPTESEDHELLLSNLRVNQSVTIGDSGYKNSKTSPPALYTMSSLLQDLTRASVYVKDESLKSVLIERDKDVKGESGGIGTPATRSDAIATNFKRKLLTKKGRSLIGTELGHDFYRALPEFAKLVDLTSSWQLLLNQVENGELDKNDFKWKVQQFVDEKVIQLKATGLGS